MENLIEINAEKLGVIIDLRYQSKNNVCAQHLYSKEMSCFLQKDAYEKFLIAVNLAKNLGYKFKIWDAYRPLQVQKFMYEKFPENENGVAFVSNPESGAVPHCRGVAIDLTLCNLDDSELEMGTDFDEFSSLAFHKNSEVSIAAQKNRLVLLGIMTLAGFDFYSCEWWHYQLFDARKYPIISASKNLIAPNLINEN
jgi:D-alanyl-D-alanine dipeptidase